MRDQRRQTQQVVDSEERSTLRDRQERIRRRRVGPRQREVDTLARLSPALHARDLAPAAVISDQLELLTTAGVKRMCDAKPLTQLVHDSGNS